MHVIRNGIDAGLKVVSIVLFAALVMVVVWQVASRNLLAAPATWTEEAARYLFVWVAMVARSSSASAATSPSTCSSASCPSAPRGGWRSASRAS